MSIKRMGQIASTPVKPQPPAPRQSKPQPEEPVVAQKVGTHHEIVLIESLSVAEKAG